MLTLLVAVVGQGEVVGAHPAFSVPLCWLCITLRWLRFSRRHPLPRLEGVGVGEGGWLERSLLRQSRGDRLLLLLLRRRLALELPRYNCLLRHCIQPLLPRAQKIMIARTRGHVRQLPLQLSPMTM